MDKDIQKELDKVITLPKKEKKELNTYVDVLLHQLEEMISRGEVGYTQEILLPIPEDMVKSQDKEAKKIIALAGRVTRNEKLDIQADINTEEIAGREKTFNMINISFVLEDVGKAVELKDYVESLVSKK